MKADKRKPVRRKAQRQKPRAKKAASTADILIGTAQKAPSKRTTRIPTKWAANYRRLLELRRKLLAQMGQLAEQANETPARFGMHMADAGTDSFERDFALSLLSSDQNALYEVEEAIKRIENGTYGVCELTGKPIPKTRLEAIPWTRFSVQAQNQLEKDGLARRAHFAELGSIEETFAAAAEPEEEPEEKPGE